MDKVNYLTRWKIQLDSSDKKMRLVALLEIVEMFKTITEEVSDSVYTLLINSDICYFLSENMSYREKSAMCLINKIICHLSESDDFFKNDFYRILKGYIRVVKSFPANINSPSDEKYHKDIFLCVSIFVRRARERGCNFKDERMSLNSIITAISNMSDAYMIQVETLDFINLVIELMKSSPTTVEKDIKHRDEKLLEVLKKLRVELENFDSVLFMFMTSKIIHGILTMIPLNDEHLKTVHKKMCKELIDKFLPFLEFVLKINKDVGIYEIFCNLFYYLLTSEKLKQSHKLQLVNRFFILDGHNFLARTIGENEYKNSPTKHFKSLIVMSEIVNIFIKFLNRSPETELSYKKMSYEIVFSSNMKEMDSLEHNTSYETKLMYAFLSFIDFKWKNSTFNSNKVFCNISLILTTTKAEQATMDVSFFNILCVLFTSTFRNVEIQGNNLLQISSAAILKSSHDKIINLSYLKWWKMMAKPSNDEASKIVLKFIFESDCQIFENLQASDLFVFDRKLLMGKFLDGSSTSIKAHTNLKAVLCKFSQIETEDHQKLLARFKYLQTETVKKKKNQQEKLINVAVVMTATIASLKDTEQKKKTALALMKCLKQPSESQHLKLSVIQIATNLLSLKD